jgi:hypothetical protein
VPKPLILVLIPSVVIIYRHGVRSFLSLQPEFDQAANGFRANDLIRRSPCVYVGKHFGRHSSNDLRILASCGAPSLFGHYLY